MRSHGALAPVVLALVAFLSLGAGVGEAQTTSEWVAEKGMDERLRVDVGGFFQKFTTTIRVDSESAGRGTEVSLEDDLGLDSTQANFRADGYWRFGRRSRIEFAYTGWNRKADRVIDRDIIIDDTTYHAGATVDSRLKVSLVELYYAYSFWNTPKFEAGLSLGASVLFNKASFEGEGTISGGGGSTSGEFSSEARSLTAPVPALGAHVRFTIVPDLLLSARVRGLGAEINDVDASSLQGRVALDYYPWKNVGIGAAYDYLNIDLEEKSDPSVAFDYEYSGPMVYVSVVF